MRANDKDWSVCIMQGCSVCKQRNPTVDGMCVSCTDNKHIDALEELLASQSTAVAVAKPKKAAKRFVKPTLFELGAYFKERNHPYPFAEAEHFIDHYTSNGWKVGKSGAMKCWKASVRNWMRNHAKGMFAAPEKTGMLGTDISDTGFVTPPPVNDDLAFLQQTRARLEHQS